MRTTPSSRFSKSPRAGCSAGCAGRPGCGLVYSPRALPRKPIAVTGDEEPTMEDAKMVRSATPNRRQRRALRPSLGPRGVATLPRRPQSRNRKDLVKRLEQRVHPNQQVPVVDRSPRRPEIGPQLPQTQPRLCRSSTVKSRRAIGQADPAMVNIGQRGTR